MFKRQIQALGLFLVAFLVILAVIPISGSSSMPQAFYYTPTPQSDGRIIYIVKENDTCISIALLNGITEHELRSLNNLEGDDCLYLQTGQELLIGIQQELTSTPESAETPTEPTPTPFKGNGTICIYLFNDDDGNAMAEEGELPIAGGEVSITDRLGNVNLTGTTDDSGEPLCFKDIPEGDYDLSVAIPEGYNPTTTMNYALSLSAGEVSIVDFGAQPSSRLMPAFEEKKTSPFVAVLGIFFVGAGVGLWFYSRKIAK